MKQIKLNKKIKEFAKEIHRREHLFVEKKISKEHKLEEYYYLMASFIFHNLMEKMEEFNIEIFNEIADLKNKVDSLKNKPKRKPSKYNIFIGEKMKQGKSMVEAVELWKKEIK